MTAARSSTDARLLVVTLGEMPASTLGAALVVHKQASACLSSGQRGRGEARGAQCADAGLQLADDALAQLTIRPVLYSVTPASIHHRHIEHTYPELARVGARPSGEVRGRPSAIDRENERAAVVAAELRGA